MSPYRDNQPESHTWIRLPGEEPVWVDPTRVVAITPGSSLEGRARITVVLAGAQGALETLHFVVLAGESWPLADAWGKAIADARRSP